ncbi:phosphatidate cytidylyltransferase [Sulfurihydrogenibium sp.]|uniref:phosphatidate cytidylyltransferase n=1 Tax=Sulfurihydrogenibium sp. TaxID=2053621 RepID=UPI0026373E1C|nr:phosphatidate cytidylyltransferase [Sulfurihydrogenibium sp.]
MSNLLQRIISATILAVIAVSGIVYLPVYIIKIFVAFISVLAVYEVFNLLDKKIVGIFRKEVLFVAFLSSLSVLFISFYLAVLIMTVYGFYISVKKYSLDYLTYTIFGFFYGVFFPSSLGILAEIDKYLIFVLFAVVWSGDICAYFVGKTIGKHKLAPILSPKKTVEGAIGSFVGSVVAGYIAILYFKFDLSWIIPVLISAILLQVGDLFESFLKRQVNVKDSSNLIPGHGGLLDRIDSLIFASVVFVICHALLKSLSIAS